MDIHQDQGIEPDRTAAEFLDTALSVIRNLRQDSFFFQHGFRDFLVQRMILAQENMLSGEIAVHFLPILVHGFLYTDIRGTDIIEFHIQGKGGTDSLFAVNLNGPAHGIDKPPYDCQTQPCPVLLRTVVPVFLGKRFKQDFPEVLAHPDSVVADGNLHGQLIVLRQMSPLAIDNRPVLRRIFHGIGKQIEINLIHPQLIHDRNDALDADIIQDQLLILLAAERTDNRIDIAKESFRRIGFRMQFHFPTLRFRHIQRRA